MNEAIKHKQASKFLDSYAKGKKLKLCFDQEKLDCNYKGVVYLEDETLLGKNKVSLDAVKLINSLVERISDKTEIAVLVKSALLFDNRTIFVDFRKSLIGKSCISNVVQLDNNELKVNGVIPAANKKYTWTCLMVLKKNSSSIHFNEFFCDDWTEWRRCYDDYSIPYEDIINAQKDVQDDAYTNTNDADILINNSYRLFPSYVMAKSYVNNYFDKISKYAAVRNGCHSSYISEAKDGYDDSEGYCNFEIVKNNSIDSFCVYPDSQIFHGKKDRFEKHFLKEGDILFSSKNSKFEIAVIGKDIKGRNLVPTNNFLVITPKEGVCTAYVFQLLTSEFFQYYIQDITGYDYYSSLRVRDILDGPVVCNDEKSSDLSDDTNKEIDKALEDLNESYRKYIRNYDFLRAWDQIMHYNESPYLRQLTYKTEQESSK